MRRLVYAFCALLLMGSSCFEPQEPTTIAAVPDSDEPIWRMPPTNPEGSTSIPYRGGFKYYDPDDGSTLYATLDSRPLKTDPARIGLFIIQQSRKQAPSLRLFVKSTSTERFQKTSKLEFIGGKTHELPFRRTKTGDLFCDYHFSADTVDADLLAEVRALAKAPAPQQIKLHSRNGIETVTLTDKTVAALNTMLAMWEHVKTLPVDVDR